MISGTVKSGQAGAAGAQGAKDLGRNTAQSLLGRGTEEGKQQLSIFPTRILLATDGSEEAELALRMAVELGRIDI